MAVSSYKFSIYSVFELNKNKKGENCGCCFSVFIYIVIAEFKHLYIFYVWKTHFFFVGFEKESPLSSLYIDVKKFGNQSKEYAYWWFECFFFWNRGGEKKTNSDIDIDNNNNWLASKSFFLFLLRTENKTKQKKNRFLMSIYILCWMNAVLILCVFVCLWCDNLDI